jgi:hypothetical protein
VNVKQSAIYKEYLAMREEIDKHKWYETEKAGYDVGFVWALFDWTLKFKSEWLRNRRTEKKNTLQA